MNLYKACVLLDVWHLAKARAEVWALSKSPSIESYLDLQKAIKIAGRKLMVEHHPDKGGDHTKFTEIQSAYMLANNSTIIDYIGALSFEEVNKFDPGSDECSDCKKWNDIFNVCMTVKCSGLERKPPVFRFGRYSVGCGGDLNANT